MIFRRGKGNMFFPRKGHFGMAVNWGGKKGFEKEKPSREAPRTLDFESTTRKIVEEKKSP